MEKMERFQWMHRREILVRLQNKNFVARSIDNPKWPEGARKGVGCSLPSPHFLLRDDPQYSFERIAMFERSATTKNFRIHEGVERKLSIQKMRIWLDLCHLLLGAWYSTLVVCCLPKCAMTIASYPH